MLNYQQGLAPLVRVPLGIRDTNAAVSLPVGAVDGTRDSSPPHCPSTPPPTLPLGAVGSAPPTLPHLQRSVHREAYKYPQRAPLSYPMAMLEIRNLHQTYPASRMPGVQSCHSGLTAGSLLQRHVLTRNLLRSLSR